MKNCIVQEEMNIQANIGLFHSVTVILALTLEFFFMLYRLYCFLRASPFLNSQKQNLKNLCHLGYLSSVSQLGMEFHYFHKKNIILLFSYVSFKDSKAFESGTLEFSSIFCHRFCIFALKSTAETLQSYSTDIR